MESFFAFMVLQCFLGETKYLLHIQTWNSAISWTNLVIGDANELPVESTGTNIVEHYNWSNHWEHGNEAQKEC